jgi:LPXTG-motif cell wall-anchored protein
MNGDGTSCNLWFDGVWQQCCDAHDIAYGMGVDKTLADLNLAQCVANTGHSAMALIMLAGVTLFGWLFYKWRR